MSDRLGRMLMHPLRRRLLLEYSGDPTNPGRLARRLNEPLNLVSYHTDVLRRHGYIELVRTERLRGALTHFYRATVATAIGDVEWQALSTSLRRSLAVGTLAQAADEARRAALDGGFDTPEAHVSRSPLNLDEEGLLEVSESLHRALEELTRIAAAARERSAPAGTPFEVVLLSFEPEPEHTARRP